MQSRACAILGVCYNARDPNPSRSCQKCEPATSTTDWTPPRCFTLREFAKFQNEFTGPDPKSFSPTPYDLDDDRDVDGNDFAEFALLMTGP